MRGKTCGIMQEKDNYIGIFWHDSNVVNVINVASQLEVNKDSVVQQIFDKSCFYAASLLGCVRA